MTDSPPNTAHDDGLARGRAAARSMADTELRALHGQGASAFKPGAWQVLDDEVRRRDRVRRDEVTTPAPDQVRYPALRGTVVLAKFAAILVLVGSVCWAVLVFPTNGLMAFAVLVGGTLAAVSYWAGAELLVVLMDIEANTRAIRSDLQRSSSVS
jgi:hypothetical protein